MATATLSDVARRAGVSVSTVSRILNPLQKNSAASKQTEVKVREIAKDLDYSPNASARALSTKRTFNIGVMWDKRMDSPEESVFWSPVLRGVMSGCKKASYECMVSVEDYETKKGFQLPRGFRERYVDGLVVTYPLGDTNKQVQQKLIESGTPFVVIWASFADPRVWSVDVDPNPGFRQALLHLVENGHKRIAYCVYPHWQVGEYHASTELEREAHDDFGIDLVPLVVDLTKYSHKEEGQRLSSKILSGELDITAMIMGDLICIETINCLAGNGVEVPKDFSVVALADTQVCECLRPRLSSLVQPLFEVGERSVVLLADNIKAKTLGVNLTPRQVALPMGFVVRESTGPVGQGRLGRGKS